MEEALRESEARFRALLDQANDAIFLLLDGFYVDCNAKGQEMYGRTREEILGRQPDAFAPPVQPDGRTSQEKGLAIFHRVLAGENQFFEWLSCLPDGTPLHTEVSLNRLELSGKIYIQAIVRDITERKRAEEHRVRSLALLQATLDSTADGILTIGAKREILSYNHTFLKMWRIPREVVETRDDKHALKCVLGQLQSPAHFLEKVRHLYDHPMEESFDLLEFKDGRIFERYSRPMLVDGKAQGRVWSFRDVTKRMHAEQAMSESELRFRTLVDQSPIAIGISREGTGLYANRRFAQIFGLRSSGDFIGRHVSSFFAPELQEESRERVRLRAKGLPAPTEFESIGLRSDGAMFPVHVIVSQVTLADGRAEIGFLTDITDRKQAEEQIARQAALLDEARDAIIVRAIDGKILFWNKGAERVYGWSDGDVVGRNVVEVLQTSKRKFEEINRAIVNHGEWLGEIHHTSRDRRKLIIDVRCTLIRDREGRPHSILSIGTDITERKRIEAQFMRAQRMESVGTLAGGIAHDLNNILAPIMMSIEILKERTSDAQSKKILETIGGNSQRGAAIVRQLLSFARGMEGERIVVEPLDLVRNTETIIKDTFPKNIQLETTLPVKAWTLSGDLTQLHQVLLNLCLNARDAMPNGGRLAIAVENAVVNREIPERHGETRAARHVVISVSDTGTGIPASVVDKIFEPFFTTKEIGKGTGLGLSMVLAIVKSHGGFVNVASNPGEGTTFKVYLPARDADAELGSETAELPSLPRGMGETILVVDDEPSVLVVTGETLDAFGYRALTAREGNEAMAIYMQHRGEIAAVLTDMAMPGMDGPATIRALRAIDPGVKIIVASGSSSAGEFASEPDLGIRYFLAKPYTAGTLLKTLRALLDAPGSTN